MTSLLNGPRWRGRKGQPPDVNGKWRRYRGLRTAAAKVFVMWNGFSEYYDLRVAPVPDGQHLQDHAGAAEVAAIDAGGTLQNRRIAGMQAAAEVAAWET